METFFFGDSQSALFGSYHRPIGAERDHAVLLCAPIGQEYLRAHWALRQLALALARAGLHVMRFDWFAVGDSAGETREGTATRWVADALAAAEELRDMAAVQRLSIVGLRLGATIAATAIGKGMRAHDLVLWDPVVSGRAYLAELTRLDDGARRDPKRYGFSLRRELMSRWSHLIDGRPLDGELLGVPYPDAKRASLADLDLPKALAGARTRTTLVCSEPRAEYDTLGQALGVQPTVVGPSGEWQIPAMVAKRLLPGVTMLQAITQAIVSA
jgi:hypothetical protein